MQVISLHVVQIKLLYFIPKLTYMESKFLKFLTWNFIKNFIRKAYNIGIDIEIEWIVLGKFTVLGKRVYLFYHVSISRNLSLHLLFKSQFHRVRKKNHLAFVDRITRNIFAYKL